MGTSIDLKKYEDYKLPTLYQQQIHLTKYARWNEELKRRETWPETVFRYMDFQVGRAAELGWEMPSELQKELFEAILNLEVMPSMRCMMTAGKALNRDNAAGYNCSYLHINRIAAFDETMYLLMCGCGVGFSVERQFINDLPELPSALYEVETIINVRDSRIGWASALRQLISMLYSGHIPDWDLKKIRPAGSPLKTFGGRASGPGPLDELFAHVVNIFKSAVDNQQRRLTSVQCHSIVCKIGDAVVAGGVRRSALISLSNLSDDRMRNAKSGQWWIENPHFALANNSAAYTERPDAEIFMEEWLSLVKSKSGERGIFNKSAASKQAAKFGRREENIEYGTNPCSEILLRDRQFCNLSEVVVRPTDSFTSLERKCRLASILGTLQSSLTDFRYLSSKWKDNCDEERLLGVSLTGIMDHQVLNGTQPKMIPYFSDWFSDAGCFNLSEVLTKLRETVVKTNKEYAAKMGINASAATTCVKPSGTVSQLVDSASGIHPRHAPFYIRTNRGNKIDPTAQMMKDQGIPCEDDVTNPHQWVFSFPQKSPEGAMCRNDLTALDQLELWLIYQEYWCEHKPSITVTVRNQEWLAVGAFVYEHFDKMSGVSFLPYSESIYRQMPYQDISKEDYYELQGKMPQWLQIEELEKYEATDQTTGMREFACTGGACEIQV